MIVLAGLLRRRISWARREARKSIQDKLVQSATKAAVDAMNMEISKQAKEVCGSHPLREKR